LQQSHSFKKQEFSVPKGHYSPPLYIQYNYAENAWICWSPITPTKIVESQRQDNMINCTSVILPHTKAIVNDLREFTFKSMGWFWAENNISENQWKLSEIS
jgi:hypothetical protein